MDYKEKVIALLNSQELSKEQKEKLEEIFPELKEGEDERIRKELCKAIWNYIPYDEAQKYIKWLEKQGKQKPTDKVEPKFKVGDYVVGKYISGYITEVRDDCYLLDYQGFSIDKQDNYHLWTIEDAKEGDVLVDEDINVIGIFEGIEGMCWHSKIYYSNTTNQLYGAEYGGSHRKKFAKPATKEQRDLLFSKMREEGYEWDDEKKEMRKIENYF